jgi:2,4-diketo-3-deoxy-L-fuconate hydrolase
MKLLRYGPRGAEKPGLLDADGQIRDLSGVVSDITGALLSPESLAKLAAIDPATLPLVEGSPRYGVPVGVGKFLAIGLNFADHAKESGLEPRPSRSSSPRRRQLPERPERRRDDPQGRREGPTGRSSWAW